MRKNPGSRGGWEQRLPLKLCVRRDLSQKGGGLLSFNTTRGGSALRPRIPIPVCFWVGWAIRGMCWCEIWRAEVKISESRSEEAIILVPVLARWASALVYHSVWQLTSLLGGHQLCDCLPLPWVLLQLFRSWSRCGNQKWRGTLRFLSPLEIRPPSISPNPAESRGMLFS